MAANLELVIRAHDQASGVLGDLDKKAGGLGHTMGNFLKVGALGAAAGLGVAGVAAVKFIGVAADMNEAINKSNVVFGTAASTVEGFAATSARSFGIAKSDAFSYASTLGTILKGSGLAEGASADMSVELVKLAADMASFNNIPIDQALEKIRAGLVGESEPLRTVGVLLSEAAVQEEAYATGIAAAGAKLTDQQKVQARYSLILKQTADTQGDFARTSGSLANQQRILGAEWKNIQGIIGNALLPIVTKLAQELTKFLTEHEDDIERIVKQFEAWAHSEAWPFLKDTFTQLRQLVKGIIDTGILQWFADHKEAALAVALALGLIVVAFAPWILAIPAAIAVGALLLAHWDEIKAKGEELINKVREFPIIGEIVEAVFSFVKDRVQFWMDAAKAVIDIVMGVLTGDWDRAWQGLKALALAPIELLKNDLGTVLNLIKGIFGDTWDAIKGSVRLAMNATIGVVESAVNAVIGAIRDMFQHVKDVADAFPGPNPLGNAMQSAIDGMHNVTLGRIPEAGADGAALGAAAVDGVRAGIRDRQITLLQEVEGMARSVAGRLARMLEVQSPSKVMFRIGANVTEGLRQGIAGGRSRLEGELSGIAKSIQMREFVRPQPVTSGGVTYNINSPLVQVQGSGQTPAELRRIEAAAAAGLQRVVKLR